MPLNGSSTFGSKHSSPLQSNGVLHVSDPHKQRSPTREDVPQRAFQDQAKESPPCDGALRQHDVSRIHEKDIENMAKEELQKQLVEQVELRKKLEREFQSLKGPNEEGTVLQRRDGPTASYCPRHFVQRVGSRKKGALCNTTEAKSS
eukprot:XP_014031995.1 PREDICTED: SKI family transcriptional corepressor 1-like isoform X6 [Salmo salar]